jgi:hypothetical protein
MTTTSDLTVRLKIGGIFLAGLLLPRAVAACACGCGVFDVGTSAMFPSDEGGMAFVQYDYQDQRRNWRGKSPAPAANNDDQRIQTQFVTAGLQYLFNRSWGVQAEVPYAFRDFKVRDDAGAIVSRSWSQFGDIRLTGIYTGFFADLAAGVTFGVKLPTGSHTFAADVVDRDTQLGTGSTDLLLGGFERGHLTQDNQWEWFAQLQLDVPALIQSEYRPGLEVDTAAGIDYQGIAFGRVQVTPLAQVIFSERTSDSGAQSASPMASGYQRLLLSPGIEFHIPPVKIYADAEFPVYQHFTGNQLAAPVLFKVSLSYMF